MDTTAASGRPAQMYAGEYLATLDREESDAGRTRTTWVLLRLTPGAGVVPVGRMAQGTAGYGDRVTCSMAQLVWAGPLPEGHADPRSPHYGIHFDTGPCETREEALREFARRADRLIAWRKGQV